MAWRHIDSWGPAADELRLDIDGPVLIELPTGHVPVDLWLKNFGGAKGTLIVTDYEVIAPFSKAIIAAGFAYSVFEAGESRLSREAVLDLLRDWTWTGPTKSRPAWLDETP